MSSPDRGSVRRTSVLPVVARARKMADVTLRPRRLEQAVSLERAAGAARAMNSNSPPAASGAGGGCARDRSRWFLGIGVGGVRDQSRRRDPREVPILVVPIAALRSKTIIAVKRWWDLLRCRSDRERAGPTVPPQLGALTATVPSRRRDDPKLNRVDPNAKWWSLTPCVEAHVLSAPSHVISVRLAGRRAGWWRDMSGWSEPGAGVVAVRLDGCTNRIGPGGCERSGPGGVRRRGAVRDKEKSG